MIEHDMSLVNAVADRVICMAQGRVLAEGTAAQVQSDPAVIAAYLGT
jgi:branched-chain amino acid transport system ATP-binding protein